LVGAAAKSFPELAVRLAGFREKQFRLLRGHLRGQRPVGWLGLNADELRLVERAAGGLLSHVRFVRAMRGFLVDHFRETHPALAGKLYHMTLSQFELLCRIVG
jgi:hypothetical protein